MPSLDLFSAPARDWFQSAFAAPTEVQERGWLEVAAGRHTLMTAPTGSGKTLAAFFWCLDRLAAEPLPHADRRCRVLYVSPLKALTVDVERNLRAPLSGMAHAAERLGLPLPDISVGVRTGDTTSEERRHLNRRPPDILITTPESLFLLLTSQAREMLRSVRWVIVDEIHSLAPNKRGAHLAISLERLSAVAGVEPQRIGLSATQRPLEEVGRFLAGTGREVAIVDAGRRKTLAITVEVPVDDMANLGEGEELPSGPAASLGGAQDGSRRSIWPAIYPRLLELIREHRSTIVFVNSRRLSERLAARLNELAEEDLVKAHHGSIAKEHRRQIEDDLKAGRLRGLVATSSLELGIDMGAVDLVLQVEAPSSVASGIQRIGRSGHSVGEISKGVILPKYRGDLLESAVVVERMLAGEIETTVIPRNPLDVLAQQVVAMCALQDWDVEELGKLVRRAYPFRDLGPRAFESTLDMLSGRYPSDEFAELRPRIVWDRVEGRLRGRAGAQRLAVTSGGTIPDRGLFTVNLLDDGRRVGELDEEMVYETRPGENFVLGASTWRVMEVTPSQVLVAPAPGEPGKLAFWKGDSESRPVELGRALGTMIRELRAASPEAAAERLGEGAGFDRRATDNLLRYLEEQAQSSALPDDRTIVVERFRDELGDWRVCVLTTLGGKVHAPWGLAVAARLRERTGIDVQSIHTDDGFALRFPDAERPPDLEDVLLDPDEVTELVTAQLHGSALFASRFRENAARALLLPRRRPGQRTPLWMQRQKSADLLQVAGGHPDFPILIETYRECLRDVFDLSALSDLMRAVRSREVRAVVVDTERASPFASSLLFDYIGQYLYEGDAPLAERRAQALTLDRELLAELLGTEELRELLDPAAIAALELELQGLGEGRKPRDADEAADLLRRLGDLSEAEAVARAVEPGWLASLAAQRRALRVRIAGEERWIAVEDAARYRDALGTALPAGLPEVFLGAAAEPLITLLARWARTHVPFVSAEPATRWGLPVRAVDQALTLLVSRGEVLAGEFRPGYAGREYCHPEVLRTLRRRSLAALRREVEPVPVEVLARFLPAWHGIGAETSGLDRLSDAVFQLQGLALPASVIERDILSARIRDYRPRLLDELVSMGEVVWVGRGSLGAQDGRVALYLRGDAARLVAEPSETAEGELQGRLREQLARRPSFFAELYTAAGGGDTDAVLDALWDLVWAGEVTNDTFAPLRAIGGGSRRRSGRPGRPRLPRLTQPRAVGRWSLTADLRAAAPPSTERLHAIAGALLQRHGVVTREAVLAEGTPGGFSGVYPVLRAMEESGRIRRGYFIDGLGASQFALPGAVDRLRALREPDGRIVSLAATDPANPYGVVIPWPASAGRPARAAGAYVVLESGELKLVLERGGRSLLTFGSVDVGHLAALATAAAASGRVELLKVDGASVHESGLVPALREAGFKSTPRGMAVLA
jgi:ATP-dependent helicase Lhr and Lhr-like helicase